MRRSRPRKYSPTSAGPSRQASLCWSHPQSSLPTGRTPLPPREEEYKLLVTQLLVWIASCCFAWLLLSFLRQLDSSIINSRESTSIIISMPPGKILLVVISRSLCECHINAKPASPDGEFAIVPEGGVVPVVAQLPLVFG